ncbi:HlyD family efflux transporter periplasmic adaptor subunit [Actinokineospora sp. G85]|uniref:HlyD family efflux transporter periplasmic adaptor subunit n=1 Tax=Actinokineospora sp. G85 TaxID=3406626 RepID=UPI003C74B82E
MKNRIAIAAVVLVVAAAAVAAVLWAGSESDAPAAAASTGSAEVKVRDLTRVDTLDGVVAYQDMRDLSSARTGIVTRLPRVGQDLDSGTALWAINEQPVVLLNGSVPAYRDLKPGIEDGVDVQQLETALIALGHAGGGPGMPDGHWDSATTGAVKAFQAEVGATQDGALSLGEVVFTSGKVHIAKLNANVGGLTSPETTVMTVQSTDRLVMVDVDPLDRDLVTAGAAVQVQLPSGKKVAGKIDSVGTTLEMNAEDKSVYKVRIFLDDPAQVADLALAPVTVRHVTTIAEDALSVPVAAVVAVPGGGYAVDVVAPEGAKRVAVTLGAWGEGYVQVEGGVQAGDKVEVAQ